MSSLQQTSTFAADAVKYGVKPEDAFYALENAPGVAKNLTTAAAWGPFPIPSPTTSGSISPTNFAMTVGGWRIGAYSILTGSAFVSGALTIILPDGAQYLGGSNLPAQVFGVSINSANATGIILSVAVNATASPISVTANIAGSNVANFNFSFMVIGQQA